MKSAAPELVLLPGLLNDHTIWRDPAAVLAEHARVSVPDYGDRSAIGEIAGEVLRQAPDSFLLAGFSMGGYVALEMLRQAPQRVRGLALVATSARPDTAEQRAVRQQVIDAVGRGKYERVVANTASVALCAEAPDLERARARIMEMAAAIGPERFCLHMQAVMNRADARPLLSQVAVPSLVVLGERDQVVPPDYTRELAAGIAGAQLVAVPDCGHMLPLQAPGALSTALVGWLRAAVPGAAAPG